MLGVEQTGPVMSLMPILLVGIVFGLAMDYQVFLVSRMREAHVHGSPARDAILTSYEHSSKVVAAAAIMITVFGGSAAAHEPLITMVALVEITQATEAAPYLAIELAIDRHVLSDLVTHMPPRSQTHGSPVGVYPLPDSALAATLRLVQLMKDPTDARILAESEPQGRHRHDPDAVPQDAAPARG
ncbi:AraC family transcriptional regulator N-terminal domain-containing protein [Actinoplanes sp. NPDC048796]|uniref:AraC family transcriptional regulator n=1 Tax=Actinoplanes sp. NPDC048796 TaxID=3155640 RepID=UPI003400E520